MTIFLTVAGDVVHAMRCIHSELKEIKEALQSKP